MHTCTKKIRDREPLGAQLVVFCRENQAFGSCSLAEEFNFDSNNVDRVPGKTKWIHTTRDGAPSENRQGYSRSRKIVVSRGFFSLKEHSTRK